jgi:predicted lipoprotein with Yx(FWY)xxD motif
MKVGDKTQTVLKNEKGLTLYYFTPDTATKVDGVAAATPAPPLGY